MVLIPLSSPGLMKFRNTIPTTQFHPISLRWCGKLAPKSVALFSPAMASSQQASGKPNTLSASIPRKAMLSGHLHKTSKRKSALFSSFSFDILSVYFAGGSVANVLPFCVW